MKNVPSHENALPVAADTSSSIFDYELIVSMRLSNRRRQLIKLFKCFSIRHPFMKNRAEHFDSKVGDESGNLLHRVADPSIRANDSGIFHFRLQQVGEVRRIVDGGMRADMYGRRADDQRGRVHQCNRQLADIRHRQIKRMTH